MWIISVNYVGYWWVNVMVYIFGNLVGIIIVVNGWWWFMCACTLLTINPRMYLCLIFIFFQFYFIIFFLILFTLFFRIYHYFFYTTFFLVWSFAWFFIFVLYSINLCSVLWNSKTVCVFSCFMKTCTLIYRIGDLNLITVGSLSLKSIVLTI